ncbi:MAG: transporter ATP-binding protein [Hyphomicrobiales bacterium]|nr:transporter ATP-binding protein [Hyphomicrobiales bacterium]
MARATDAHSSEGRAAQQAADFICLRGVSLVYGEGADQTLAVDRLDLSMSRGELVAIVGPSGCGKSTLMKLVSGLTNSTTGLVEVRGRRVVEPVEGVGMAFQNPLLMPWRTTLRNVTLPLEVIPNPKDGLRRDRAWRDGRARDLLGSVGLSGFEDKYPWQLSGGMQQRANLCRAIIHAPEILLLDEPFGALDTFTREDLWLAMQRLWMEQKFTSMLVTHDLQEAAFLADRIYVMSGRPGRIIQEQEISFSRPRSLELLADPDFTALVSQLRRIVAEARVQ